MENDVSSPFKTIRVVECGQGVSAAFGTKLLADLGADVIKVEPPEGDLSRGRGPFRPGQQTLAPAAQTRDPMAQTREQRDREKSGSFIYLNTNKRSVVIDLRRAEGQQLLSELLNRADVLLHNTPLSQRTAAGLDSATLHARHPRLIVAAISIFGEPGPYADYKGYELTASNASGWAFLSPGASPYPDLPPLKCFGSQCNFQGGVHSALTVLAAYFHRVKSGQAGQVIEVSEQEAVAAMLEMNFMHYTYAGRETSRLGSRALGPWFIADCADGQIFVLAVEEDQWQRLVEFMGNPEWASEELFRDRLSRAQNMDALKALMTEWLAGWKVQDLYRAAQEHRIPFAPINTMRSLYESEHLRQRNFFVELDQPGIGKLRLPGMPSQYGKSHWAIWRPAPQLGEHNEEVFCGELGLTRERLAELRDAGIV
ncbi:MAG: CoA transferase [Deltaproteobacteria bacterium]|nr:CoA transferase [Deltaproteobacteria bacterium]